MYFSSNAGGIDVPVDTWLSLGHTSLAMAKDKTLGQTRHLLCARPLVPWRYLNVAAALYCCPALAEAACDGLNATERDMRTMLLLC